MSSEYENVTVRREPDAIVTEHHVARRDDSNWALWVAGIAVFVAVLVLALFLLNRNGADSGEAERLAAEAEASRLAAEQAIADANQARIDAATSSLSLGNQVANNAAAASAAAAQAAADRAAAVAAQTPRTVVVQSPPAPATPAPAPEPDVTEIPPTE